MFFPKKEKALKSVFGFITSTSLKQTSESRKTASLSQPRTMTAFKTSFRTSTKKLKAPMKKRRISPLKSKKYDKVFPIRRKPLQAMTANALFFKIRLSTTKVQLNESLAIKIIQSKAVPSFKRKSTPKKISLRKSSRLQKKNAPSLKR